MAPTVEERRLRMLQAKRGQLFGFLQRVYDLSGKLVDDNARAKFRDLMVSVEKTKSSLVALIDEVHLLQLELDDKFEPNYSILDTINEIYGHVVWVEKSLRSEEVAEVKGQGSEETPGRAPRLPKIELPSFSGEIREWEQFYDLFKSLVHENTKLSNMDKLYYLTGCLKGQARNVCSGLAMSPENYEVVWDALVQRYHDTRALANAYLGQIMDWRDSREESEKGLNAFLERYDASVRALRNLNLRDLADFMFLYHALSRLNPETVNYFELNRHSDSVPEYEELVQFVKLRVKTLVTTRSKMGSKPKEADGTRTKISKSFLVNERNIATSEDRCGVCGKAGHQLSACKKFLGLNAHSRYIKVKELHLCYNCLSADHGVRNCPSTQRCDKCPFKHHRLIHHERPEGNSGATEQVEKVDVSGCCMQALQGETTTIVLLGTVTVEVESPFGGGEGRFLLDNGSQANLVSHRFCKLFGLHVTKVASSVRALGDVQQPVRGMVTFTVRSRFEKGVSFPVTAWVVERITGKLPQSAVDLRHNAWLKKLPLADTTFAQPGPVEGIFGAEIFSAVVRANHRKSSNGGPLALETSLGYVVMGRIPATREAGGAATFLSTLKTPSVEALVKQFWEMEAVPEAKRSTPDDDYCEKIFREESFRDETGRFTVALPFRLAPSSLGDSRAMARKRYFALEGRMRKISGLREGYHKAMRDFIDQGHIYPVEECSGSDPAYYIPHHAVYKRNSQSTPVRIVLDASAPSDNGLSLNSVLHMGPKLQADIGSILMRFRLFPVAMVADIRQMYRQINVVRSHRRFQRIFWRWSPEEPLRTWELGTLAFGVTSSPYLALRCVQELLQQYCKVYPKTVGLVGESLYMDDLVISVPTVKEAEELFSEAVDLFKGGQFDLTKWATNSDELFEKIPVSSRAKSETPASSEGQFSILGLIWDPREDVILVNFPAPAQECTKRSILSSVARCFDPIGLSAPLTLHLKIMVKELWSQKLDWDDEAPRSIQQRWQRIQREWSELKKLRIRRSGDAAHETTARLLGFADACKDGYGGVVYLQKVCDQDRLQLVCAKSRVSPVKLISIPRLELCAALLLAKLVAYVREVLSKNIHISEIFTFSDSLTVLQWLSSDELKDSFVKNRVALIKERLPQAIWRHIPGKENPADGLSRGLSPSQLVGNELWFHGPNWAGLPEEKWPGMRIASSISELKALTVQEATEEPELHPLLTLVRNKSSWTEILRVTVWVLRGVKLLPKDTTMWASDLQTAERILITLVQRNHFGEDIRLLGAGKLPSPRLRGLNPFIHDGALRVGGRLSNSNLPFGSRHPFILPKRDCLTERIIDYYHQKYLHTGPYLLEALLRRKFWILAGRSLIKKRVRACNRCFRANPRPTEPLMADLPKQRVQPAHAFSETGVDYFGPINISLGRRKGSVSVKAYVALFVCMAIKAIHLELVSSLSTEHFLQAFKRFLARRGSCKVLYSDRGTNFVGAQRKLSELADLVQSKEYQQILGKELAERRILWKFNPASAPHMGGLWESQVKVVKKHLTRVIGEQLLSYEELNTLLVEVEALLNSRPLCQLSADPAAPSALTPAHFLHSAPLEELPAEELLEVKTGRLNRFQLVDQMVQSFWKRWNLEYLTTLQNRHRWSKPAANLRIGTVVVLKADNSPPLRWPLAVITDVFPGRDGIVRTVRVRCGQRDLTRPAVKVCPLPTQ